MKIVIGYQFRPATWLSAIINGGTAGVMLGGGVYAFRMEDWWWAFFFLAFGVSNIAVDYGLIRLYR